MSQKSGDTLSWVCAYIVLNLRYKRKEEKAQIYTVYSFLFFSL